MEGVIIIRRLFFWRYRPLGIGTIRRRNIAEFDPAWPSIPRGGEKSPFAALALAGAARQNPPVAKGSI